MQNVYWLTNVRLETGYKFNNEVVTGTETALHHLLIQDGKIAKDCTCGCTASNGI